MFKAILFDLDGTLLNIDMNIFLEEYFKTMVEMATDAGFTQSQGLVGKLFKSTGAMIENRDPAFTNQDVFMSDFFSSWHYTPEEFEPFFAHFYQEGFPRLGYLCRPFAGIPELLQAMMEKNSCKLVVATNAVFPLTALEQRITWAGVDPSGFDLITSYEIMHFCKPHLEYYQEICAKLQLRPQDCLMVGNDMGEDIIAQKLGMRTYLVEDLLIDPGNIGVKPNWRGSMQDFLAFAARFV